ncbi:hypothetical protein [Pseudorhizobium flavum]|jgi:hypothetical protein|uniref:hypothetical protein n=1 Tax=Pseudorhizobium flavum TaxID=1335061 RepID=UPI003770170E
MTWFDIVMLIAILSATVTLVVAALIRGGARKQGLDQKFLDDEQAKTLREWNRTR